MKKFILTVAIVMGVSTEASAQSREQQVYSPYPQRTFTEVYGQQVQPQAIQQQRIGTRRVYPGREIYGTNFGPLPRHPGDYRDAVDRGQWSGGGTGQRSFSID